MFMFHSIFLNRQRRMLSWFAASSLAAGCTSSPKQDQNPVAPDSQMVLEGSRNARSTDPGLVPDPDVTNGPRLDNFRDEMMSRFPGATRISEESLLPQTAGGTTFMGLIGRLLGEGIDRQHEGLKTRRFIYAAERNNQPMGFAHGARFEWGGRNIDVFVFYTAGASITDLKVINLPERISENFQKNKSLEQFIGQSTHDFEVRRGRRGRIISRGAFLSNARRPPESDARAYFERVLRSVRFNAAFMDVAMFITQHPDLAEKPVQEFPEEAEVRSGKSASGPEAFIGGKRLSDPFEGRPVEVEESGEESQTRADETGTEESESSTSIGE